MNCVNPTGAMSAEPTRRAAVFRMAVDDNTAAVASRVVEACVVAAEEFAVKAGAGSAGDLFGRDGIEPVLSAALTAAGAEAKVAAEVRRRVACSVCIAFVLRVC